MKLITVVVYIVALHLILASLIEGVAKGRRGKRRRCNRNQDPATSNCVQVVRSTGASRRTVRRPTARSSTLPTIVNTANSTLACPGCEKLHCPHKENTLNCPGTVVLGVCGCCQLCAKQEGQSCGGRDNYLGTCDTNLTCQTRTSSTRSPINWRGICKMARDEDVFTCKPDCSHEFCSANPTAVCSARNAVIARRSCQDPCQHTSCKSCYFQEVPRCMKKCAKDNYRCMKSYARCVKKFRFCKSEKKCKKRRKKTESFRCWVPECV